LIGLRPPTGHRQQYRDVVHHHLNSGSDRPRASQAQQVECRGSQRGHSSSAIAPVAIGVLMGLVIADPMPALKAPAVAHQLQQPIWGDAQAGE